MNNNSPSRVGFPLPLDSVEHLEGFDFLWILRHTVFRKDMTIKFYGWLVVFTFSRVEG